MKVRAKQRNENRTDDLYREYLAYRELQATNEYLLDQLVSIKTKYCFYFTNGQLKTRKKQVLNCMLNLHVSVFPDLYLYLLNSSFSSDIVSTTNCDIQSALYQYLYLFSFNNGYYQIVWQETVILKESISKMGHVFFEKTNLKKIEVLVLFLIYFHLKLPSFFNCLP